MRGRLKEDGKEGDLEVHPWIYTNLVLKVGHIGHIGSSSNNPTVIIKRRRTENENVEETSAFLSCVGVDPPTQQI